MQPLLLLPRNIPVSCTSQQQSLCQVHLCHLWLLDTERSLHGVPLTWWSFLVAKAVEVEQSREPPMKLMGSFRSLLICSCDIQCFVNNIPRNRHYLYIELLTVPVIWILLFSGSVTVWLYWSMWGFFDLFFYLTFLLTSKGFTFVIFQWSTGKLWHINSLSRTEINFWLFKKIKE